MQISGLFDLLLTVIVVKVSDAFKIEMQSGAMCSLCSIMRQHPQQHKGCITVVQFVLTTRIGSS